MKPRNTVQRQIVLQTVQQMHNHPTADSVYEAIIQRHPSISKATVYRNLNQLVAEGVIQHVPILHGADRFDFRTETHYHARCVQCGAVFDVQLPELPDLIRCAHAAPGMVIEQCCLFFEGHCAACQSLASAEPGDPSKPGNTSKPGGASDPDESPDKEPFACSLG